jgi:hypothetical protein
MAVTLPVTLVLVPGCAVRQYRQVSCDQSRQSIFVLEAQAVPSATLIPCMGLLPPGWTYGGSDVGTGLARFWFDSDRVGPRAIEVLMTPTCDVSRAPKIPLDAPPPGLRRYQERATQQQNSTITYFVFPGGCVTYRFSFTRETWPLLFDEADRALGFKPRSLYVNSIREQSGLTLCGANAPRCPGK